MIAIVRLMPGDPEGFAVPPYGNMKYNGRAMPR